MSEGKDAREAFDMACELIQEAKGMAGPGSITDHLDAAENWIDVAQQRTRADDWQDIATAPRDGTKFLGGSYAVAKPGEPPVWRSAVMWWDDQHHFDGWDEAANNVLHVGAWMAGKVGSFAYEEYAEECPTHWRPLPAAPQVSA